jgi:hypothetical protein
MLITSIISIVGSAFMLLLLEPVVGVGALLMIGLVVFTRLHPNQQHAVLPAE